MFTKFRDLVTGTVEATAKDAALVGKKLLLTDLIDGAGKVAVPAFVSRMFRHSGIYIRTDKGIDRPEDLKGMQATRFDHCLLYGDDIDGTADLLQKVLVLKLLVLVDQF